MSQGNAYLEEAAHRLKVVAPAVATLRDEITGMMTKRIELLVEQNDEGARGGIKALRELLELPAMLQSEHDQLQTGLPQGDPDFD